MTADSTPSTRPRISLVVGIVLSILGMGVLWTAQNIESVCPAIYPAPPGCFASDRWIPLLGIALVLLCVAAQVVIYATARDARPFLIALSIAIVGVVVVATAVSVSQTGFTVPFQLGVPID